MYQTLSHRAGFKWLKNTVNLDVGTNDGLGIKVGYSVRRKKSVLGDTVQCMTTSLLRPQNPKLSLSGTRVLLQVHPEFLLH